MKLAKPCIDVGLFCNDTDKQTMLDFWQQQAGVTFSEILPVGGGVHQHRHDMRGSVLKLNVSRDALVESGTAGYQTLSIVDPLCEESVLLCDPTGNRIRKVPPGFEQIQGIAIDLGVRDLSAHREFFNTALQLETVAQDCWQCGTSLITIHAATENELPTAAEPEINSPGYRYLTIQVYDVDAEHQGILERGGREGSAPRRLGDVAKISFVRDPDGNWIEISQRASLTGTLE